jgi:hypothetical protein
MRAADRRVLQEKRFMVIPYTTAVPMQRLRRRTLLQLKHTNRRTVARRHSVRWLFFFVVAGIAAVVVIFVVVAFGIDGYDLQGFRGDDLQFRPAFIAGNRFALFDFVLIDV